MKPTYYVDFTVDVGMKASVGEVANTATHLFKALHAAFSEMPGLFALDLPGIDSRNIAFRLKTMRVFSENASDHEKLMAFLDASRIKEMVRISQVKQVPKDFSGPFRLLKRIRIRGRDRGIERITMMKQLEEQGNVWLTMRSSKNRNMFRFYLDCSTIDSCDESGTANNYGLSTEESKVYLPIITS